MPTNDFNAAESGDSTDDSELQSARSRPGSLKSAEKMVRQQRDVLSGLYDQIRHEHRECLRRLHVVESSLQTEIQEIDDERSSLTGHARANRPDLAVSVA